MLASLFTPLADPPPTPWVRFTSLSLMAKFPPNVAASSYAGAVYVSVTLFLITAASPWAQHTYCTGKQIKAI